MDQHLDERLQALEKKLDDTYKIVVRLRRSQQTAAIVRSLYWVFVILLGFGAFYFIQPYLDQLKNVYSFGGNSSMSGSNVQQLLDQFKQLNTSN